MKRLLSIGIVSSVAAVVLFAAFHYTRAQGKASWHANSGPPPAVASTDPSISPSPLRLVTTFFTQSYYDGEGPYMEGGTWYAIDSRNTFSCALPCTLEIDAKPEVWGGSNYSNWMWVVPVVDGAEVAYIPVVEVPEDGSIAVGPFDWTVSLGAGTHTVQSWVEMDDGAYYVGNHNSYRVYYPYP